jgi:hypothetical protein
MRITPDFEQIGPFPKYALSSCFEKLEIAFSPEALSANKVYKVWSKENDVVTTVDKV